MKIEAQATVTEMRDEISRLESASECSIECEHREKRSVYPLMTGIGPGSMNIFQYFTRAFKVSVCKGGYDDNIQKCPKYRAEIDKLKGTLKPLLEKI